MAYRLGDVLECAQFNFVDPRCTQAGLKFLGDDQEYFLELTGTGAPDLCGKRIGIWTNPEIVRDPPDPEITKGFNFRQVGTTGLMTAARWVKYHECTTEELIRRAKTGERPPFQWKRCLYLEWFSQNGRVVLELIDPIIDMYVGNDEGGDLWTSLPEPDNKPQDENYSLESEDEAAKARDAVPFGQPSYTPRLDGSLFLDSDDNVDGAPDYDPVTGIESYLQSISRATDKNAGLDGPETDDEFIREMDYLEDVIEGKHDDDDPLMTVLPECDYENISEEEAEPALKAALAVMALHSMVLHYCEHMTAKDALKFLYGDYAHEGRIHPGFLGGDWVTHVDASEQCAACLERIEAEYNECNEEKKRSNGEDSEGGSTETWSEIEPPF